jgi:hypothetical protein
VTTLHRDYLELAAAAIDFPLGEHERGRLASHLADCPACRRRVEALHGDVRQLAELPRHIPTAATSQRLWGQIDRPRRRSSPFTVLAFAAMLTLLAMAGIVVGAQLLDREPEDLAVVPPSASPSMSAPPVSPSTGPSTSPSLAPSAVPSTAPSPALTPEPAATPPPSGPGAATPTAAPNVTPTLAPAVTAPPAPVPDPVVVLAINGSGDDALFRIDAGSSVEAELTLVTEDVEPDRCTIQHTIEPSDGGASTTDSLAPLPSQTVALGAGWHRFTATCPGPDGNVTADVGAMAVAAVASRCADSDFTRGPISASSFEELRAGVVGTWVGCATTPWLPPYAVAISFRKDGTYSAVSNEIVNGQEAIAFYYGTDDDVPGKRYAISDLQDDGTGVGEIDIVFDVGTVNRGDLRNIRLMGDKLEFEFFHRGEYGPLTYRLTRSGAAPG